MMKRFVYIILIGCIFAGELWAQNYIVEPLSLNNHYSNEKFAIPYSDGVIFASDRRTHFLVSRVDTTNLQLFHLFYASNKDSAKWSVPQLLSKNISINSHQASCTISADGREIFFSVNDESGQRIYTATKSGADWGNIRPFTHNRANYITTHPSLSPCGRWLFFASDMPGGLGGFDIYVCERTPRGWTAPKNLGPGINTSENELYPFVQTAGLLFFSSTAHGSLGGLDIFTAYESGGVWGNVQRMEEPINSTADDIAYTSADIDGSHGYFASNRNGKNFDIYSFKSLFPTFPDCRQQEENDYTYYFNDEKYNVLDTTSLKLMWVFGEGIVKYGELVTYTFPSTGQYEIVMNVVDTLTHEIFEREAVMYLDVEDIEQPYISVEGALRAGTSLIFDASKTYLPDLKVDDYYWMFGDGKRTKGMRVAHTYSAPGVYRVRLGVVGRSRFTDVKDKVCTYLDIIVGE